MSETVNHHKALIYVMVTMSAVDRTMNDEELARIGSIVRNLPVFMDFDEEDLVEVSRECMTVLSSDNGLETALSIVKESLPEKLYETAYALAVEVAAADLHVEQEELRFLQMLRDRFNLDKLALAAIERGAKARHMTA